MKIINESLDYMDMEGQLDDKITIDEYSAKMGTDEDIVTITFTVHSKLAADDLVTWFERGYDFVLDASVSDGELEPGKWLVFVEMDRRSKVPSRLITLLNDLETLTGIDIEGWKIEVDGDIHHADEKVLHKVLILNPNVYKEKRESAAEKMNEMRQRAGIEVKPLYTSNDPSIKDFKALAGL